MTTILTVPPSLDDGTFEALLQPLAALPNDAKVLLDARHTRWSSPYGLVALLTLAQSRTGDRPQFIPPEDSNTASYWARSGFFRHAEKLFELTRPVPKSRTGDSNFFLELTPIAQTEDVQHVVAHIQERSAAIMETLGFPPSGSVGLLGRAVGELSEHHRTCRWRRAGLRCRRTIGRSGSAGAWW